MLETPIAVQVRYGDAFPPRRLRFVTETPLWVQRQGFPIARRVQGELFEWLLTEAGDWYGRVHVTVPVDNDQIELDQVLPANALTPCDPTLQTRQRAADLANLRKQMLQAGQADEHGKPGAI